MINTALTYPIADLDCEGCAHEPIPGIRFATRGDGSRAIERCDTCRVFPSDDAAFAYIEMWVKSFDVILTQGRAWVQRSSGSPT